MYLNTKVKKKMFGQRVEVTIVDGFTKVKQDYEHTTGNTLDMGAEIGNLLSELTKEMLAVLSTYEK